MRKDKSFHLYALITILFWSLAYVFTRLALQCFSVFSLGFLRYFTASLALLFIVIFNKIKPPKLKDLPIFAFSGAFGFFLYMIVFNLGTSKVTAATSSVIIATVPVITAVFARIIFKEKIKAFQWAAISAEFSGIIIIALIGNDFTLNYGVILLILASIFLSAYNIIQRKLIKTYSSLQVTSYSIFFGTAMLAVFSPASVTEIKTAPPIQIFYILFLGVFSGAIAYVSWAKAFSKAEKTTYVSNYMFLTPFITAVFGFIIAKETPDFQTIIGGIVIMLGVLLFNKEYFFENK